MLVWQQRQSCSFRLEEDVHVWRFDTSTVSNPAQLRSILSNAELERADRFLFDKDRNAFVIAHGNLRLLLGKYLATEPKALTFATSKYGKPELTANSAIQFNLSHSGKLVLVAFHAHRSVGIDVEVHRDDIHFFEIVDRFFSKHEMEALHNAPQHMHKVLFYRLWTRKEAFIKAVGKGLNIPLGSFDVSLTEDAKILNIRHSALDGRQWGIKSIDPESNYSAAIACALSGFELKCWKGH